MTAAGTPVEPPDKQARAWARTRQDQLTKPTGALGRLEDVSVWAAGVQGRCPPRPFARIRVVVVAGDHGVVAAGVSAYPVAVTAQMVHTVRSGRAAVNVFARQVGATVRLVDLAVDAAPEASVTDHRVRRSSGRIDVEDALTAGEVRSSLAVGKEIAAEEAEAGADLLVVGDLGIGNTTPAAALVAAVTGVPAVDLVGSGTGVSTAGWRRKVSVVERALARANSDDDDPVRMLTALGGADFAATVGLLAEAARRGTPLVLDGVVSGACALLAERLAPGASAWWLAGHRSPEPAHRVCLDVLGLDPLLDLGMRLGEGTGALLAVPLVQAAIATLAEMATFAEAGVSDRGA